MDFTWAGWSLVMLCCPTNSSPIDDTKLACSLITVWFVPSPQDSLFERKSSTPCFSFGLLDFLLYMMINIMDETNEQFFKPSSQKQLDPKWKTLGHPVKVWHTNHFKITSTCNFGCSLFINWNYGIITNNQNYFYSLKLQSMWYSLEKLHLNCTAYLAKCFFYQPYRYVGLDV